MRNFAAVALGILTVAAGTPSLGLEGGNNYPGAMCEATHNAQADAGQTYITSRGQFVTEGTGTLEIVCPLIWAPVSTGVASASILVSLPEGEEAGTRLGCELIIRQPAGAVTSYAYNKRTEQDDHVTWEFALAAPAAEEVEEDAPAAPAAPADFYAFFLCQLPASSSILSYYIVEAVAEAEE